MNREPEDLPLILATVKFPGDWDVEYSSNVTLNTKSPHAASADAGFFCCINPPSSALSGTFSLMEKGKIIPSPSGRGWPKAG
jgi:L-fucose isomerase-like protein